MARTTAGFYPRGTISGREYPAIWEFIIANSQTITIGDLVRVNTSGYVARVTAASNQAIGVCTGIVDRNGISVFSDRAIGLDGVTSKTESGITVSSTNQSNDQRNIKVQVMLDSTGDILWFNDANADLTQSNLLQSGQLGTYTSGLQTVGVSTLNDTMDIGLEIQLIKRDPDGDADASKGLWRITNTQLFIDQTENSHILA